MINTLCFSPSASDNCKYSHGALSLYRIELYFTCGRNLAIFAGGQNNGIKSTVNIDIVSRQYLHEKKPLV